MYMSIATQMTATSEEYVKNKGFPYSLPSVWAGADPGVQAVSPQVTISHPPGGMLPLLSSRPAVTFPATEHHRPLAGTKLYCLVTEADRCEQLAQGCYAALPRVGFEPTIASPTLYPLRHRATHKNMLATQNNDSLWLCSWFIFTRGTY